MRRLTLLLVLVGGCIQDLPPRECSNDGDCVRSGDPGRCLVSTTSTSRWCAFTATECDDSRLRWGALAGDGLAETCVAGPPPPDATVYDGAVRDGAVDAPIVVTDGPIDGPVIDGQPPVIYDAPIVPDSPPGTPDAPPTYDARPPVLSSQPTSVSFGTVVTGMNKSVPVEIHNDGGLPTGNLTVGITGSDAARFSVTSDMCTGKTVAAGAFCTLSVMFSPTVAGARVATLTVGAGAASVMVSLGGTGRAPDVVAIEVSPGTLTITEGQSASFNVNLSAQPATSQTVMVMSSNSSAATVSTPSLMFTTTNWASAQPVTVTAVEDVNLINDAVSIQLTNATMSTQIVSVTATDNDTQRVIVSTSSVTVKESGAGNSTTVGVSLAFQPAANVTVNIASVNGAVATVSPLMLTFRPDNYSTPQNITITGAKDDDVVNAMTTVNLTATGATGASVSVTSEDIDVLGIVVSTGALSIIEGQTDTFKVRLTNQPTVTTVLDVTSDKMLVATVDKAQLSFSTSDWNVDKTVTVKAESDANAVNDTATVTVSRSGLVSKTVAITTDDINCASDCECPTTMYCGAGAVCQATELATTVFGMNLTINDDSGTNPGPWVRVTAANTAFSLPTARDVQVTFKFNVRQNRTECTPCTVLHADTRILFNETERMFYEAPWGNNTFSQTATGVAPGQYSLALEFRVHREIGEILRKLILTTYENGEGAPAPLTVSVVRNACP